MPLRAADLPSDPDRLAALALTLAAENERLRAWVDSLKAMVFGPRSERRPLADAGQGALDLGDTALCTTAAVVTSDVTASDDRSAPERTPRQPRKPATRNLGALPKHLPRCERVIEPESTACPCCAGAMHRIGEDVSEALDVVPAIYQVLRTIRPKYACRG
ncbi:IS66 family transposase zinc-finger binding domain-containing protein, partial [Rhodoplanes sp. SY1]|uniref:IS66 family transposase zinc-finger binding domain-containing protein n=1 Tax=Rhodoplanes sp. SY1 TaxID=3166646 RepID=UPI0038B662FC